MFLAWRDLRVARGRFALVGVAIGLIALLTTLVSGLATGLVNEGISGLRDSPMTHLAFQPGAERTFSRSSLSEANLEPWAEAPGVEVSPLGMSFFNARTPGGETVDLALFGVPEDSFLAPRGEVQSAPLSGGGVVLSEEYRDAGLRVGDELVVVGPDQKLTVLGFTQAGFYGHVAISFTSLSTWQKLLYGDNAVGRFSAVAIKADSDESFASINVAASTETATKEQAYQGSPGFTAETATMSLIRGFLLAISALIVGAFFTVWTVQRTRQIGLMKALGASNGYVVRDALGQLGVVLVAATAVGALLGVGLGNMVGSGVPFSMQAQPIVVSSLILIVLGMAGSLVAVRRITAVDPIVALGAEH